MKKVNLLAAAVLAAAFAMPAQADYTPNAYFGGYFRSGNESADLLRVREVPRRQAALRAAVLRRV